MPAKLTWEMEYLHTENIGRIRSRFLWPHNAVADRATAVYIQAQQTPTRVGRQLQNPRIHSHVFENRALRQFDVRACLRTQLLSA
jgi:hypothetical protein